MSTWKDLSILSKEYTAQRAVLREKLERAEEYLADLPKDDDEYKDAEKRTKILRSMERDLREISRESGNYYKKGWWRSEHYTFNNRKPREYTYAVPHETDGSC